MKKNALKPKHWQKIILALGLALGPALPALAQSPQTTGLTVELLREFASALNSAQQSYVDPGSHKQLVRYAIKGMLERLDPESSFLDEEVFQQLQVSSKKGGLGLELGMRDGYAIIVSTIEGSPAAKSSLRKGDLITEIDGTNVLGMTLNQVVKQLRGQPDTPVRLLVQREGAPMPLAFSLERKIIRPPAIRSQWLAPEYLYLQPINLTDSTAKNLAQHLQNFYGQDQVRGIILDLRNNAGGLFSAAVAVSAAFLPADALVVSTQGRAPGATRDYHATPGDYLRSSGMDDDALQKLPPEIKTVPLLVLINEKTAAGSEIIATALQDHKRARILGSPSQGSATIQSLFPLGDGTAIKLTTSVWLTPNGRSIAKAGVIPDLTINSDNDFEPGTPEKDRLLQQALGFLKKRNTP